MTSAKKIPAAKIYFPKKDLALLKKRAGEILESGSLILGKYTQEFEEKFARYSGVKYAVAVSSGTAALEILLRICKVEGKEVVVPTNTNFATAAAVLHAGGNIKFIDADPKNLSVTPESIKKAITKRTAAVIVVHIGGIITPRMPEIKNLCRQKKVFLIEDASHAHGSNLNGRRAGSWSDAATFSLYPTKVITSGEGGLITTNSKSIAEKSRVFRDQGKHYAFNNKHYVLGNSWRMSEIHAAIGLSQLARIEEFIKKRREIASFYDKSLKKISGVNPLLIPSNVRSNYYKYIAFLNPNISRSRLKETLKAKFGVSLSGEVYSIPCHQQPVFRKYSKGYFPLAEKVAATHICLPIYPEMGKGEARYVVESLNSAISLC